MEKEIKCCVYCGEKNLNYSNIKKHLYMGCVDLEGEAIERLKKKASNNTFQGPTNL